MSPSASDLEMVESFVENGDYASAIAFSEERLEQQPGDAAWVYQLGLLLFLDDMSPRWYECIEPLRQGAEQLIDDSMAPFWYAYALIILVPTIQAERNAEEILRDVLEKRPDHAYANIVLAGGLAGPTESLEALTRVLAVQPNNRRALVRAGELLINANRPGDARPLLERAIEVQPHVETRHGIMNRYMSNVLCGANSTYETDKAWKLLGQIDGEYNQRHRNA